jgi:hypothetical protein
MVLSCIRIIAYIQGVPMMKQKKTDSILNKVCQSISSLKGSNAMNIFTANKKLKLINEGLENFIVTLTGGTNEELRKDLSNLLTVAGIKNHILDGKLMLLTCNIRITKHSASCAILITYLDHETSTLFIPYHNPYES